MFNSSDNPASLLSLHMSNPPARIEHCRKCDALIQPPPGGFKRVWPGYCEVCIEPMRAKRRARRLMFDAHKVVAKAVRSGLLAPIRSLICADCGKPAQHYDHRDYTKPLEVRPVCASCNMLRGPGLPYLKSSA